MTMFEFATATRIIFGNGTVQRVPEIAMEMGTKILVVTGSNMERARVLIEAFPDACVSINTFQVHGEPTVDVIADGLSVGRRCTCNVVIGIGGGSALDTGKAIAALLTNSGDVLDYLEVIGKGQQIINPPKPFIAIPTTAGTGTEVTRNAVLASPEHRTKVSLRHPMMLPRLAVIDPELTCSMPPAVTASTGLDAFTQVLEPFVSIKANPLADAICREGIVRASRSLRRAFENGDDTAAREDMAIASLCGGLALANAGLGAVHGFAGPIGGMFPAPHGAVCARLLPYVMAANVNELLRSNKQDKLERFEELARLVTASTSAHAEDGIKWIENLCTDLHVPSLADYGITANDFESIVAMAKNASSMKGNPVPLNDNLLLKILEQAAS